MMTAQSLNPPATVRRIAERLEKAGFETWCVGGAVRDALLGHPHLDWDLATAARPEEVRKLFKRTVPVGIEFGTIGVLDINNVMHEVTTFRRDVNTDGRHAVVEFGASLEAAPALWDALLGAGVTPVGLAARDTLRLEVCFHLYGNDLMEERGPIEAGLGWCCKEDTGFIGSEAVRAAREAGPAEKLARSS